MEARAWLQQNRNPSPLASNRFSSPALALAFVEQLYQAGAIDVLIVEPLDEPERLRREGGPYADRLLVRLPADCRQRNELYQIYADELGIDMAAPTPVPDDLAVLLLWWD